MRSKALLAGLLLGAVCFAGSDDAVPVLRFAWALVYRSSSDGAQAIDYSGDIMRMSSGDRFRIHFQPLSRCYFYMYLHDSQKDLYLLGQAAFGLPEGPEAERGLTLPSEDNWYVLDASGGVELLYLIVSDHRLRRLEALSNRGLSRKAHLAGHPRLARKHAVLEEIRRIILESSALAEPAQKPVTVAGEFRGITEEGEYRGVEVAAPSVYVRTIRLEH